MSSIESATEIKKYFSMLPNTSGLKKEFNNLTKDSFDLQEIKTWVMDNLYMGSIDVNIMTKVDKENYSKKDKIAFGI